VARYNGSCRFRPAAIPALLEPVLAGRAPGVAAKRGGPGDGKDMKLGLYASPNPFNPATRIELNLAAATTGKVRIASFGRGAITPIVQPPVVCTLCTHRRRIRC